MGMAETLRFQLLPLVITPAHISLSLSIVAAAVVGITVNILPRTSEYAALEPYILYLAKIGVDAVMVSDIAS